jgi:20S proteasome subunit alpha 7
MLAERLSLYFQAYTLYSSVRPFGLSAIVAGWDSPSNANTKEKKALGEPKLFCVEPSGVYWGYRGCAIGKGRQLARTEIEKLKLEDLTVEEALVDAARMYVRFPGSRFSWSLGWLCASTFSHSIETLHPRRTLSHLPRPSPPTHTPSHSNSIHTVHDEAKDKAFELELSWISPASGWKHAPVPKEVADEAEAKAKKIIEEANEMEE